MANSVKQAITTVKEDIVGLKSTLEGLKEIAVATSTEITGILGKDSTSHKEFVKDMNAINKQLKNYKDSLKKITVIEKSKEEQTKKLAILEERLASQKAVTSKRELDIEGKILLNKQRKLRLSIQEEKETERLSKAKQREAERTTELNRAYVKLTNQQKQAGKVLQDLIVTQGRNSKETRKAQRDYDRLTKKVNQANLATNNFAKGGLRSSVRGIRNLLGAFGLIGGIQIFADAIKSAFNLTTALDSIGFSMRAVIKDSKELAQTQIFLKQIANQFGAEIVSLTQRYVKFRAAAEQAGFAVVVTQKIFSTFTKVAGVLGLKTDEMQGIFLALEQMISKGKITTEELRRQLGERLPGAMDIMAASMKITTAELDNLMKKGEVITKDVLENFATQVEIAFGLDNVQKVETLRASVTRLKNGWTQFVEETTTGGSGIKTVTRLIDTLANNIGNIITLLITGGKAWLAFQAGVVITTTRIKLLNFWTKATTTSFKSLTVAMKANIIGIITALIWAAYEAYSYFNKSLEESVAQIKENTDKLSQQAYAFLENEKSIKKLAETYEFLRDKEDKSNVEMELMDKLMKGIAKQAPETITETTALGEVIAINTEKLKEYNKENKIYLEAQANKNIKEATKTLEEYEKKKSGVIGLEEKSLAFYSEELGEVIKRNGVYFRYNKLLKKYQELKTDEIAIFEEEKKQIRDAISNSENLIKTNKDLISNLNGVLTVEQQLEQNRKNQEQGRKAYEEHTENMTLLLPKLKKELKEQEEILAKLNKGGVLVGEEEKIKETKKNIADLTNRIKELTGAKKNDKKIDWQKGSIAYFENQIKLAKDVLVNNKHTTDSYAKQKTKVEELESSLLKLKKALGIETDTDISKEMLQVAVKQNEELIKNDENLHESKIQALKQYQKDAEELNIKIFEEDKKKAGLDNGLQAKAFYDYLARFEENKLKISELNKEIFDDNFKQLEKSIKTEQDLLDEAMNREIVSVGNNEKAITDIKTKYEKKKNEIALQMLVGNIENTKMFTSEQIRLFQNMINEIIIAQNKLNLKPTETDADKLKKRWEELKDIFSGVTDTFGDVFDIDFSKFDFIFDRLGDKSKKLFDADSVKEWANLSKELIGGVLDASLQRYEIELQEAQRVRDLTLNNDLATEEAKENARRKFEREERRIKTERAKKERENNLIKIAVDTAVAVTKTFAEMGFLAGLPFAGLMLGIGATQAAIVASQPLPQFEKGGVMNKDGLAITQEKRPEPIVSKDGRLKTMGSKGGDALTYLEKGDRVFKSQDAFFDEFDLQRNVIAMNAYSNGDALSERIVDLSLLNEIKGLKASNDKVWGEVKKLASRPINVNNKVEIKQDRAY